MEKYPAQLSKRQSTRTPWKSTCNELCHVTTKKHANDQYWNTAALGRFESQAMQNQSGQGNDRTLQGRDELLWSPFHTVEDRHVEMQYSIEVWSWPLPTQIHYQRTCRSETGRRCLNFACPPAEYGRCPWEGQPHRSQNCGLGSGRGQGALSTARRCGHALVVGASTMHLLPVMHSPSGAGPLLPERAPWGPREPYRSSEAVSTISCSHGGTIEIIVFCVLEGPGSRLDTRFAPFLVFSARAAPLA